MSSKKPKLVRCKKCSNRVIDKGVGFQPKKRLICSYFDKEVTPNDGCTFGSKGESSYSVKRPIPIDICGDSATNGDPYGL